MCGAHIIPKIIPTIILFVWQETPQYHVSEHQYVWQNAIDMRSWSCYVTWHPISRMGLSCAKVGQSELLCSKTYKNLETPNHELLDRRCVTKVNKFIN